MLGFCTQGRGGGAGEASTSPLRDAGANIRMLLRPLAAWVPAAHGPLATLRWVTV